MFRDNTRKVYMHFVQNQIDQCRVWLWDKRRRWYSISILVHCYPPEQQIHILFIHSIFSILTLVICSGFKGIADFKGT